MIRFHLITLFQEACEPYLNASILGRAQEAKKIKVLYQNPRTFVDNKWGKVDERPYGGGPGMVMTALPVVKAVKKSLAASAPRAKKLAGAATKKAAAPSSQEATLARKVAVVWFVPGATPFTNAEADKLGKFDDVVLVCGRYEGIDERAFQILKKFDVESKDAKNKIGNNEKKEQKKVEHKSGPVQKMKIFTYSVGEATLTGGEVPALAIIDAVTRRLPGVLGKDESIEERRIASHEVYTRPETIEWEGKKYSVPKVLQTGNHKEIEVWKKGLTK